MPKDFKIGRLPGNAGKTPAGLRDDSSDDQAFGSVIPYRRGVGPPREALLGSNMRSRRSPIAGKEPAGLADDGDSGFSLTRPKLDARSDHDSARNAHFGD